MQIASNPSMTCAELEKNHGCNCRSCYRCGDSCTQKCSLRESNLKGSHSCATWYKMDPKYTVKFLEDHAVVTGTENRACTCDGCNGNRASSYCKHDKDDNSDYMDIDTAKAHGQIGKMRLAINDDMLDPEKCKNNEFCRKHTCLEVHAQFRLRLGMRG